MKKNGFPENTIAQWSILLIVLILYPLRSEAQDLADYKWNNRLVFLVGTSIESKQVQNQLQQFLKKQEDMADRDLLLFLADGTKVMNPDQSASTIALSELRKVARITADFEGILLLGKDGGYKLKKDFPIEPKEIFDLIDGMPMRRFEMKNKR